MIVLKRRSDFLKVSRFKAHMPSVTVKCIKTKENILRFGFTASKKIGNAVKRNRAKRRLRAVARDIEKSGIANSIDCVFIAVPLKTVSVPFCALLNDCKNGISKFFEKK